MAKDKSGYVANTHTKEFHSLKRHKPECNVLAIAAEHQQIFRTMKEAHDAGFDACAHCVKRYKSRDNK